jgi:glutathione-regulated potassium-efflux system ancillary protein KefC
MMSTRLTFCTISALSGLNHKIITQAQYSYVVGTVIASAVVPTIIANTFFLPRHLLPKKDPGYATAKPIPQPAEPEAV